jgi:hypothetical protein
MDIKTLIRELSGPRPLRWVMDIISKSPIWNCGAQAVSLETQPTVQIMGAGKDPNLTYFEPTKYWCRPGAQTFNFINLRYVEGLRY